MRTFETAISVAMMVLGAAFSFLGSEATGAIWIVGSMLYARVSDLEGNVNAVLSLPSRPPAPSISILFP